jgi:hypothetical protein
MHPETDKRHLIDTAHAEYGLIFRTVEAMTPELRHAPDAEGWWSVKDTIAHLTAWMQRLNTWLDDARAGVKPSIPEAGKTWDEMDAMNDERSEIDRHRAWDDVWGEFGRVYAETIARIEEMSEDDIFISTHGGLWYQPPAELIRHNLDIHFREHWHNVRRWWAKQG